MVGSQATRGKPPRAVDRYHNLGTTMTVETKSLAAQISDGRLPPDKEENDENEEAELTPSPGMPAPVHHDSCGL